jgi:hypothetical protein
MLRPSSARRRDNLRSLVVEFAVRDIGRAGAAALLKCSLSASHNYLTELVNAGVVLLHPVKQNSGCVDRTLYRLNADPLTVRDFLAGLAEPDGTARPNLAAPPEHVRQMWRDADFFHRAGRAPVRRDPLVAALFGAAGHS